MTPLLPLREILERWYHNTTEPKPNADFMRGVWNIQEAELLSLMDTVVKEVVGDKEKIAKSLYGKAKEGVQEMLNYQNALRVEQQKRWKEIKDESL